MRILLVNDDGIDAPGIRALIAALHGRHELAVMAPDGQRSGFSQSINYIRPISVERRSLEGYEDIPAYAEQMFEAGADLTGRDAEDVFRSDFKAFSRGDVKFGVGQSIYMTDNSRAAAEALVRPFLPEASRRESLPLIFYMFTDMKTQSTDLMVFGYDAEEIVRDAFHVEVKDGLAVLPGVVSRKKQLIPPLLAALQAHQE